jgi:hypothetical protein
MKLIFTAICIFILFNVGLAQTVNVNYTASSAIITNPERGFCEYSIVTVNASNSFPALTASSFTSLAAKNQSVIFRMYYLTPYTRISTIPAAFITRLNADFTAIRNAGFKVVLRFAYKEYTGSVWPPQKPYNDAPKKDTVLSHINQLKSTLLANSDVIMSFQSGFWGLYGETYYTDNYGDISTQTITAQNIADRKAIIDAMFTCVGPTRKLQTRTPPLKAAYYSQTIPADTITLAQAYNGTDKTRIGGFNDCFLADFNDYTYADTTTEKPFWATESKYTMMGGETCVDNVTYTNCANAQKELRRFNWTFCNDLYRAEVINRWKSTSPGPECFTNISNNLGYRLVLLNGTYSSGSNLSTISYSLTLKNEGYAAPINPRNVELFFRNTSNSTLTFAKVLSVDPRLWFGGSTITLSGLVSTPTTLTPGNYELLLKLSDPEPTLTNVKYNIRTANGGSLWESATGLNKLNHTFSLVPSSTLSVKFIYFSGQMINGNAKLDWEISSDPTIVSFDIENSFDGINFNQVKNQTAINNKLFYTDYHFSNNQHVVYYRIKAIHTDGKIVYSNIIKLNADRDEQFKVKTTVCTNVIELSTTLTQIGRLTIFDATGKVVYNNFVNNVSIIINCANWAKGMYYIKNEHKGFEETKKIIVQ